MDEGTFQKPSLTEVAYEELKANILSGKMPPGHKLVVNDLVNEWKISNTPIKEALNRLVTEGLVEAIPRRGMRVRVFSPKELREIFEVRSIFEVHCCGVAVDVIDHHPEALVELGDIFEEMTKIIDDEYSYAKQYQLDKIFHTRIVSLSGNDMIIREFELLRANIISFMIYAGKKVPLRRQADTHVEHRRILDALRAGNGEEMKSAMQVHLFNTCHDILKHM